MKTSIGSYQAKTTLPELLRQVQMGKKFTITNRGADIAELVPCTNQLSAHNKTASINKIKAFMQDAPVAEINIKELISAGRK